jgi:hypothetical protein
MQASLVPQYRLHARDTAAKTTTYVKDDLRTQIRYNLNQVSPAALIGAVETWQSDFGALDVIVNVQQASDAAFLNKTAFLIDPRFVDVAFLRPFQVEQLAKTGDADAEHVIAEYTLRVGAPKAHAILPQLA